MTNISLQWEMAFLLIAMPIYVFAMAVAIAQQLPHTFHSLPQTGTNINGLKYKSYTPYLVHGILLTGIFLHSTAMIIRGLRAGHVPMTNLYESFVFISWAMILATLGICIKKKNLSVTIGTVPLVVILLIIGLINIQEVEPIKPILRDYWLVIHAGFSFLSYAAFAIACISAVIYLFQEREIKYKKFGFIFRFFPPLENLDKVNHYSIIVGFILLTLGIISGAFWSRQVNEMYWTWGSKEILSIVTWILYAAVVQVRLISRWGGRKVAYLSIISFCFVLIVLIGSEYLVPGWHSFLNKSK